MKLQILICIVFSLFLPSAMSRGINGGMACATCTVVVGLLQQIVHVEDKPPRQVIGEVCQIFPDQLFVNTACVLLTHVMGKKLAKKMERNETADVICYSFGFCHVDPGQKYCHLFPEPKIGMVDAVKKSKQETHSEGPLIVNMNISKLPACRLPGISQLCKLLDEAFQKRLPTEDLDLDKFSILETLRGSSWRGKDCNDIDGNIYPGRRPVNGDKDFDSNCNGIYGVNSSTGKPYEEELCPENNTYGLIYIGDSVGAHFHAPVQWFTGQNFSWNYFSKLPFVFANELDWPQTSFTTGYAHLDWPILSGPTDSIYLRLRQHNLCSHRDYQNICFNGAGVNEVLEYVSTIARDKTVDKPSIVFYAVIGNDVCYPYMKSPDDFLSAKVFKTKILEALQQLDAMLPSGSHVILMGFLNGEFIYPTMHKHLHPVGYVHQDVTYEDVYDWFNCMQIGPCYGWLNKNATFRHATTKKADEFSRILRNISKEAKYNSFDVHYMDNPLHKVVDLWEKDGHPLWTLLEPVDSIHPVQEAQPYIAKTVWNEILQSFPEVIGKPNKNNPQIKKLFGDQGGH